jgi:hypothetical protein
VRYDDDDAPVAAQGLDSTAQGILAVGVEVRIGLIEHNQKRVAEDSSCKANPLALARGKGHTALADARRVSLRQAQDNVVHASNLSGLQYRVRRRPLIEPADILGHRALEQCHVLRQVADMAPQILVAPLIDGSSVEPHDAMLGRPDSDQSP